MARQAGGCEEAAARELVQEVQDLHVGNHVQLRVGSQAAECQLGCALAFDLRFPTCLPACRALPPGPQFGPDQPCSEGMYAALLREIELASKFSSER